MVTNEAVLDEVVREWAHLRLPDDPSAVAGAVAVAVSAYRSGTTVSEACREVHLFLGSWFRHPSHLRAGPSCG